MKIEKDYNLCCYQPLLLAGVLVPDIGRVLAVAETQTSERPIRESLADRIPETWHRETRHPTHCPLHCR